MVTHLIIWAALTTVVVFLGIYRIKIGSRADEMVHLEDSEAGEIPKQSETAKKIAVIDRWGITLTVISAVYLLAIGGWTVYVNLFKNPE